MFDSVSVERSNGLVAVIDWLSFTDVGSTDLVSSLAEFGFLREDFTENEKGAFGYKRMLLHNGSTFRVLFDGNDNMGFHYDFSGSSIHVLFSKYTQSLYEDTPFGPGIDMDINVLLSLFQKIRLLGHITRLDLAIDNKKDIYFSLPELQSVLEDCRYTSKFRSWQLVKDCTTSNDLVGATIYLGSRKSDIMLRVYDKQLEQIAKGVEGAEDLPWVRWEIELKNDYANIVLTDFLNDVDVGSITFGILANYLRIIIFDDSNKSRCSSDPIWEAFIQEVSKIRLFVMQEPPTLLDKQDWVLRQVAPTITGLILAKYGDISWLTENLSIHALRMNKQLQKLVSKENPDWKDMFD